MWPWYFIMDVGLWTLAAAVVFWAWPHLGHWWRLSACLTAGLVMILQSLNEVLSRQVFQAWTFSYEHNRMVGVTFLGEPLEEHLFWWAFAWMLPFFYLGLVAWFGKRDRKHGRPVKVSAHE